MTIGDDIIASEMLDGNGPGMGPDDGENGEPREISAGLKAFAILSIVSSLITVAGAVITVVAVLMNLSAGETIAQMLGLSEQAIVLHAISLLDSAVLAVLFIVFGIRILRNQRRHAALITNIMIVFAVLSLILVLMTRGLLTINAAFSFGVLVFLIIMHVYLDPQLSDERRLQRKLRSLEARSDAEEGVLGRDKTGKGYIELNFFNLFWIFVVACFLGWLMEMLVCPILNGKIEERAGLLFGPFSPIYGVGATLMAMALNRFYKSNPVMIFAVSGVIGATFEFFVSWFFENAFGILAWDYSNEPLNLFGRTDLLHGVAWGVLGLVFLRFILPWLLQLINRIPWNWRYGVTSVCAVLMVANCFMTLLAFNYWFERASNLPQDTPVAQFYEKHFGDDFMKTRFSVMSIDPNRVSHS